MILADTSAWVEFDRATDSRVDQRLTLLIRSDGPLAVTEPVIMEVVAGAENVSRAMMRLGWRTARRVSRERLGGRAYVRNGSPRNGGRDGSHRSPLAEAH